MNYMGSGESDIVSRDSLRMSARQYGIIVPGLSQHIVGVQQ